MPERTGPQVYSIAAHRGFADALVAGLLPRYAEPEFGLARLTLLLPSRRAARTVTEAFVRAAGDGLLLPRMAMVGDLDLDEALGPLLDPLGEGGAIPPAADPSFRWLRLAEHIRSVLGTQAPAGAALLRQAFDMAGTIDRLLVEGIDPRELLAPRVIDIVAELSDHWRAGTQDFLRVHAHWRSELEQMGQVDPPTRRNMLFVHAAREWRRAPRSHPIIAAGVTSASPALAGLLRVVSELPRGAVILPDLDLSLDEETWGALGSAGIAEEPEDPPFGRSDASTHPQYHLKLLLNRMGVSRSEVQPWHRSGPTAAPPARSKAISNLFLPPASSARWVDLPPDQRRLTGVRLMESAHPGEEAQAIALLIRQSLDIPEKRIALITPDRGLASRVVAQLRRWGIEADDTAGRPLPQTAAGRVLLLLADVLAQNAAPVPLVALLSHPKARAGEERASWLENVRRFDLALRGPRPDAGLGPLRDLAAGRGLTEWWEEVEAILSPLFALAEHAELGDGLDALAYAGEALCGEALWGGADGRALSAFVEELREAAREAGTRLDPRELAAVLRDAMDRIAVRPPWGGHPRVFIYGLLEARMARADLVICGGLTEGVWPASATPDSLLPPAVLRALGVPGPEFRIGLAAHDLAAAMGAPEVVLSHAHRDEGAPVVPSRFVLRVRAMLGEMADDHRETEAVRLARAIDNPLPAPPYPRPRPRPAPAQRQVEISATGLDRLRSDPYQFYASTILQLRSIDALDAEPGPQWKGIAVHAVLDAWHTAGGKPGELSRFAEAELDKMSAHPLMRSLWRPRLMKALEWIDAEIASQRAEGRIVLGTELDGQVTFKGVQIAARADRIDRLPNGKLAVVDYKTGQPPSALMVEEGFSLQLGLVGLIAAQGGFVPIDGEPERFEYWSLARRRGEDGFGYWQEPILEGQRRTGIPRADFLPETARYLADAIDRWIQGDEPFTARLNPDIGGYNDYDQLMRLDEWIARIGDEEAA